MCNLALLENLHWIPVQSRINYTKLSAICHNFFSDSSLSARLSDPLLTEPCTYFRQIRSSAEIHTVHPPCYSERNKNLTHTHSIETECLDTSLVVPPQSEAMEFSSSVSVSVTSFSLPILIPKLRHRKTHLYKH